MEWWSNSTCLIYTDEETWEKMGKENSIFLVNHSSELDGIVAFLLSDQLRLLGVSINAYALKV